MRRSWFSRSSWPIVFAAMALSGVALGFADSGGPQEGTAKTWDCGLTSCAPAPKKDCPANQAACCCNTSTTAVPIWVVACYAGGDCGGGSSCQTCS
jgi:hypothetical protein